MRYLFIVLMFVSMSVGVFSQEIEDQPKKKDFSNIKTKITGRVLDAESTKPIESANVQIYSLKDTTKLVKGTATDQAGNFTLSDFKPGKYELRISVIGYNTARIKEVIVSPMNPEVNVGEIKIKAGSEFVTSEITVEAEQNVMEMGVDKKVFNVEKDINSQSGSVTDVLKNIPSVTVDSDGNISIRGSGNVKILINGKPSGLLSTNPMAVLEQIPANTVERIEIINNPSAKYDPEGMSGIINIVLKKGQTQSDGYNFNLSLSAGTGDKYNLSTGLAYKIKDFNFYGNYSYRLNHMGVEGALNSTNFLSDSSYYLETSTNMRNKMLGHLGTIGFDYDINKSNYLGMSVSYSNRDRNRNELTNFRNFGRILNPTFFYDRRVYDGEVEDGLDANLNYKLKFDKKFQELNVSSQFSTSNENNTLDIIQQNLNFDGTPLNNTPILEKDYTDSKFRSFTFQGDYIHPLKVDLEKGSKMKSKFELGLKSQFRKTDDNFRVENFDYNLNTYVPNNLLSNDFKYSEQIHAVYGTFENTYKKFGYQVGLRLEQTFTKSEQMVTSQTYENNYFSFFPSIFLKQGITNTFEAQASYTRRINRPGMQNLNPFVNYSDPQNLRVGNPYLKPEYINGIELGVVKYLTTFSLTSSVFYRLTNDVITRYSTFDSNGVSTNTVENLSKAKSYGVELIGTGSIFKWWFVNASASYFRTDLEGNISTAELNSSGYSWTSKLISNMTFPNLFDFQLSYFFQGRNVTAQGYFEPIQSMDVTVKKDFLNKRMSLGFRVSDVFNSQRFSFYQNTSTFNRAFNRKRDSRAMFLTFTYRIGTDDKKQNRKKPQQEDNRDREGQEF